MSKCLIYKYLFRRKILIQDNKFDLHLLPIDVSVQVNLISSIFKHHAGVCLEQRLVNQSLR